MDDIDPAAVSGVPMDNVDVFGHYMSRDPSYPRGLGTVCVSNPQKRGGGLVEVNQLIVTQNFLNLWSVACQFTRESTYALRVHAHIKCYKD